jgi:hypothetical protein
MSCLDATFTLTPQSPLYSDSSLYNFAYLFCNGADFSPFSPTDLSSLYASNRFFFDSQFASDPNLDYTQYANRKKAPFLESFFQLQFWGAGGSANKQLVLIFGFDVYSNSPGRLLIYSDGGRLKDQQLIPGDNQFVLEIESLIYGFSLYFIHVGGSWFFRGLSGYVV